MIKGWAALVSAGLALASGCRDPKHWSVKAPLYDVFDSTLLRAVGVAEVKVPAYQYDDELKPYLQQFLADAKLHHFEISPESIKQLRQVVFVEALSNSAHKNVMASCNRYRAKQATLSGETSLQWMTIEVLQHAVERYVGTGKSRGILMREVLYHELMHCLGGKGHLPSHMSGIMSAIFTPGNTRSADRWDKLVSDMFSPQFLRASPDVG